MLLSENPKMKRTPHESREANIAAYKARVTRVTLSTPDLGSWEVFEWKLFENNSLVDQGSCPFGDSFISHQDVFEHLEFKFVEEPQMEVVLGPYCDADPGL